MLRALFAAIALLALTPGRTQPAAAPTRPAKPRVEVVFCLDTTASMTGLIDGAKAKIWSICNQIATGEPVPELKVGLVAYRDRGDDYVTRVFDLTDDLDAIHGQLKKFEAKGGGDIPESVNQALSDAVHKVKWSTDKKTLKIIFLVGDAEPHMNYTDDVKYPETCKKAVAKDIIINTIQCGNRKQCAEVWKDIALKSEGTFVNVAQDGGVAKAIDTPYDKDLVALNKELTRTVLVYGGRQQQLEGRQKNADAVKLDKEAASARVAYQARNSQAATYCLLDAVRQGKVKLAELKDDELPAELKKLNAQERKEYLEKLEKKRAELNKQVLELDKKRQEHIAKERTKEKKAEGFDGQVLQTLRKQAKKYGIGY